jgi:hypothetical protein
LIIDPTLWTTGEYPAILLDSELLEKFRQLIELD